MLCRDRGHSIASTDNITPTESPSMSRSPSPPINWGVAQPSTKLQVSQASSSTRLTGSKRALSSRSNQDSAQQLMPKQRLGRVSTAGRSSTGVCRSSADVGRSLSGIARLSTGGGATGGAFSDLARSSADIGTSGGDVGKSTDGRMELSKTSNNAKDSGRSFKAAAVLSGSQATKPSPARLQHTASVRKTVDRGLQGSTPVVHATAQEAVVGNSPGVCAKPEGMGAQSKETAALRLSGVQNARDCFATTAQAEDASITSSCLSSPSSAKQAPTMPRRHSLFRS